jgi:ketosteroid isomerase-like protein
VIRGGVGPHEGDCAEAVVGLLSRHREEVTEHQIELVRDAYQVARAWEMRPVRELLASGIPGHEAAWCVMRGIYSRGCQEVDDLVRDLFSMSVPRSWEIAGLEIRKVTHSHDRIVVLGVCRCRPRGGRDDVRLPFLHVWHVRDGRVTRLVSSLDAVELRRAA